MGQFAAFARRAVPGCGAGDGPMGAAHGCSLGGAAALTLVSLLYDGCSVALDRNQIVARGIIDAGPARRP